RATRWRNISGFWLLGLCNNFAYVVMLSAAHDILSRQEQKDNTTVPTLGVRSELQWTVSAGNGSNSSRYDCNPVSTAAILLADILPTMLIKFTAPFYIHVVPYGWRVVLCVLTAAGSFLLVSFSSGVAMSILGVVFASVSAGLGELSFLSLTAFFHSGVLWGWSSGTGGAGVLGALSYSGLTQALSPRVTVRVMLVVPVVMAVSYFMLLVHPPSLPNWRRLDGPRDDSARADRRPLLADYSDEQTDTGMREREREGVDSEPLSCAEKLLIIRGLLKYIIPLSVVYFAEYFINQGLLELLYFPNFFLKHSEQYRWYQTLYQVGVFVSRSSLLCVQIQRVWILALLQCGNAVFLFSAVYFQFLPSIYIIFVIVIYEGLLGGAGYVNTFNNISKESSDRHREFALAAASVGDSVGIALSGATALPLHDYLCSL
ncbi:CLN3 protein, partial [Amia calva]|nr:CLN3 protein [Amia calva]